MSEPNQTYEQSDNPAEGDRVRFTGCSPEQIQWGNNGDPVKAGVFVGAEGTVERVEVHTWHTKLWIRFANGGDDALLGPYNSVCFEKIDGRV